MRRLYRYIRVLNDYQLHGVVYKHGHQENHWPEILSEIFENYLIWRKNQARPTERLKERSQICDILRNILLKKLILSVN